MATIRNLSPNQPTRLHNVRCAYCNAEFKRQNEPEKEHVVGKNFVPKGTHQQQWNLHLNSCHKCNQIKSKLENDISAITMIGGCGEQASEGSRQAREARRKSKVKSQRTGKKVEDSFEEFTLTGNLGNAEIKINVISPPQLNDNRAFLLAEFQLRGFFYFLTYCEKERVGYCWPGAFMPLEIVLKSDWGNPLNLSFSEKVKDWEFRFSCGKTARGYYRALIKKNPNTALWSWSIEWNKTTRIFGFFGDEEVGKDFIATLSAPSWGDWVDLPDGTRSRSRSEKSIGPADLDLFFYSR